MSEQKVRELRHGYYACVSYVDALIGRLLAQLRRSKIEQQTIIVLWGDHGYHLGEQGLWTKANNYELSTHVPLIVSAPGLTETGQTCERLVELIDVYPTLAELCGVTVGQELEGKSLKPLLSDPDQTWSQAVFSQYPRDRTSHRHRSPGDIMGYAVRTERYRYVEWQDWKSMNVVSRELYDHANDPHESKNIANNPVHAATISKLAEHLRAR